MKKIIAICLLVFLSITGNAQVNNKSIINEFNRDSLKLASAKSISNIEETRNIVLFGTVLAGVGGLLLYEGYNRADNSEGGIDVNTLRKLEEVFL